MSVASLLDLSLFVNKKSFALKGVTLEVLLFFLKQYKEPVYVIASNEVVERASIVCQDLIGESFLGFLPPFKHQALGFVNFFDETTSISIQALAGNTFKRGVGFVDKNTYKVPLVPLEQKEGFCILSSTLYGELIDSLRALGYLESEEGLSSGHFFIRGGAIDVFPFNSSVIIRVSFLDALCSIYRVEKKTNQIKSKLDSYILFPKLTRKKQSLFNLLKKKPVFYYDESKQLLSLNNKKKIVDLKTQVIDYHLFIKKYKGIKCLPLGIDVEVGFKIGKLICVPFWFLRKNIKIEKQNLFLVGKTSLVFGGIYIHDDFGFCKYLGLEVFGQQERVCLQFADGKVRLDVYYLSKLSFCSVAENSLKLSFLNRPGKWKQKKLRAFKEAEFFVKELMLSYSNRASLNARRYNTTDCFIEDFVGAFKYKDTKDQQSCWEALLSDFNSTSPVNRLICGDVGFGKTELAIRAAIVSIINKEQVVVLAPTTLLANQLYHCFLDRVNSFGVTVGVLSRFSINPNKTVSVFLKGKTDILIGTSSVLFRPQILQHAGLFIVDEEHRFGVKDKEVVFKHSPGVNFISMSATPLPRTLELSLKNIRNISTIQTPPVSRKPIISSVCFYNIHLVSDIIIKEFSRGGQVYFVDNSVDKLRATYNSLVKRLPNINIDLIFGSMKGKNLLNKMNLFVNGTTRVLLTTTIIESGIDVGATNTIIINNAHLFGLSQLHQLRGRVGRSSRQAFAWFLVPKKKLSDIGTKRLGAIIKHGALGSGYHISLEDLGLRGSGSLFGYKQSGDGVGFEYYSKLISLAVRGESAESQKSCLVDLNNSPIPSSFINCSNARAFYYKMIFSASSNKELQIIKKEIVNLYGFCSKEVLCLLLCRELSFLANKKNIQSIVKKRGVCTVVFSPLFKKNNIPNLIQYVDLFFKKKKLKYRFVGSYKSLIFKYQNSSENDYILMESFINNLSFIK